MSEYKKDRNYDWVRQWIEEESNNYARSIVLGLGTDADDTADSTHLIRQNPKGKVMDVTPQELQKYKNEGPVFVDYYAPWCTQ